MNTPHGSAHGVALDAPRVHIRKFWPPPSAAALPLLLILVLVATTVSYNAPLRLRLLPTDETRQVFYDFHGLEWADDGPFRWTNGNSRICFEQLGRVSRAVLNVRILGAGAYALGREHVSFFINDRPIVTAPIQGVTRVYRMHIGDALAARDDDCLRIVSDAAPISGDVRTLGVPFAGLTLTSASPSDLTWPALAQLALNLAVAALAFSLLRQLGVAAWSALIGVGSIATLIAIAIQLELTVPGLGLARHMLPIAAGLAALSGGLAALRAIRQRRATAPLLVWDLLGMAFWGVVLVGVTWLLQKLLGLSGMWPLKAGFFPSYTPLAVLPVALFALWAWLVLRGLDSKAQWGFARSAALVLLGGLVLAVALRASVRGWASLFLTFTDNPFEYISDVPRVGDDPASFLRHFVAIKSELALHSSTHPPGAILLLWAVAQLFGAGPVPASWVAIILSALAPAAALWAGHRLGGPRLGLLAGAVAAVMPGQLVYGVTSMDGVFNMLLALGAAAFLIALEPGARPWAAVAAGVLIAAGLFFTYAATQLFFFGATIAAVALWRGWREMSGPAAARLARAALPVLRQGLIAAGVIALIYLGLFLATGFNVVEGALRATAINAEVMRFVKTRPFLPPSLSYYTLFLIANLLAFSWYLGPWGLTGASGAGMAALRSGPRDGMGALAAGLAALVAGMALSGLFNREVERIWGFTYPLVAVLIARHALQGDEQQQRWRAGLFLALAFGHGLAIRVLLNTFW